MPGDLNAACAALNEELDFWEKLKKPVMFTEYGTDTIAGLHDACAACSVKNIRQNITNEWVKNLIRGLSLSVN